MVKSLVCLVALCAFLAIVEITAYPRSVEKQNLFHKKGSTSHDNKRIPQIETANKRKCLINIANKDKYCKALKLNLKRLIKENDYDKTILAEHHKYLKEKINCTLSDLMSECKTVSNDYEPLFKHTREEDSTNNADSQEIKINVTQTTCLKRVPENVFNFCKFIIRMYVVDRKTFKSSKSSTVETQHNEDKCTREKVLRECVWFLKEFSKLEKEKLNAVIVKDTQHDGKFDEIAPRMHQEDEIEDRLIQELKQEPVPAVKEANCAHPQNNTTYVLLKIDTKQVVDSNNKKSLHHDVQAGVVQEMSAQSMQLTE